MYKLAFFSTSSRPINSLKELSKEFDICLIVTKTDKKIGKSKEKTQNEIKKFAIENNIKFFEIDKFDTQSKQELKNVLIQTSPDIAITFDFGFIVPKELFDIPKYKIVNIHFSLLPKYRGASAVQFAILNDEKEYGITYHLIDATLDTGDILYQSRFPLNENFNSEEAYQFLFDQSSVEICEVIQKYLRGQLTNSAQNHKLATYTYSKTKPKHTFIFKEDAYISSIDNERYFYRQVKAFNPWPKVQLETKTLLSLKQFKDFSLKSSNSNPILKINDAEFNNNQIKITEVTVVNGKTLSINDFISGYLKKN